MQTVLDGNFTHWREAGEGDTVLLIHGFPFHAGMWEPQLQATPPGWRFVAPDLRGFRASDAGPGDSALTMDGFADDLIRLLDHMRAERIVVCGLSMGGYIAFALWRRHPDRIRALVLCDTRAGADTDDARAGRYALAESVRREGAAAAAEAMLPKLVSDETREQRPGVVEHVRLMIEGAPPVTIVRALHGLAARADSTGLLEQIAVPTLVIVGDDDALAPPAESEAMAQRIPGARLVRIPGAGHVSNLEAPAAFNRALHEFLAGLD